jgi:hypothetical protein
MAKKDKLYVKRYKTLKEHRAAVAARKALKGGKNKGPVANAAAYGETLTKKAAPAKSKSKPKASKPKASSSAGKQRFFAGAKGGKYDKAVQNKEKAKSNFFRSSSGTYGKNLPSNPKLKSQDTSRLTGRQKIALEVNAAAGGKDSHKRSRNKLKVVKRNRRGRRM